jgi:hypothetical protein
VTVTEPEETDRARTRELARQRKQRQRQRERERREPQADPGALRTNLLASITELEAIRARLAEPNLNASERATLRLRADVTSRLVIAHEKLAKLPEPESGADHVD